MSSRLLWIDISKGIAIVAVVLLHINYQFYESKFFPLPALLGEAWHVPVFFLLGGFFIKEEKLIQPKSFIKGKITSLYSLLLYFYIPAVLLHNLMIYIGFYNTEISYGGKIMTIWEFKDLIKELILSICLAGREPILGAMWFVYVLFIALCGLSIISGIIHYYIKNPKTYESIRCFTLLFLCIFSCTMSNSFNITIPRFNNTLTAMWLIYCGYMLRNKLHWNFTNKIGCLTSIFIIYHIIIIQGGVALNSNSYHDVITLTISAITALYIINFISQKIERTYIGSILAFCGKNSFYIMGLHFIGFKLGTIILSWINIKLQLGELMAPAKSSFPLLLFYLIFSIAFSLGFIELLRQIKKLYLTLINKYFT